ncbi:hypothetical protein BDA99DRAFT_510103 [Phascolomyces articulosus]|uniref:Uncharacterized protein n=1 Tax=Phascolomyces articulosus TaxID=60185 RepID=A0AAD5K0W0_9FUNG|nr:hypothetical protein BDA99DRAFT_510103 [Phascolomyces articulosus]
MHFYYISLTLAAVVALGSLSVHADTTGHGALGIPESQNTNDRNLARRYGIRAYYAKRQTGNGSPAGTAYIQSEEEADENENEAEENESAENAVSQQAGSAVSDPTRTTTNGGGLAPRGFALGEPDENEDELDEDESPQVSSAGPGRTGVGRGTAVAAGEANEEEADENEADENEADEDGGFAPAGFAGQA